MSAVIVNHNSGSDLLGAVDSLLAEGISDIIVLDNASNDGSTAALVEGGRTVKVIESSRNRGFGGGANRGAAAATAPLLLICNPDLVVHAGAVAALARRLESDPAVALAGPALLDCNGHVSPSARAFPAFGRSAIQAFAGLLHPGGHRAVSYRRANAEHAGGEYVDWVTGACMLVRRDAFDEVGGFDEGYFMYLEEVDLCWRLRRRQWRVAYVPSARVTHVGGTAARRRPYRMVVAHHASLWRYARRSTTGPERVVLPLVGLGLLGRLVLALGRRAVPGGDKPGGRPAGRRGFESSSSEMPS